MAALPTSSQKPQSHDLWAGRPTNCLFNILSDVHFIIRPQADVEIPSGWTFHPLTQSQQSQHTKLSERGYFHHATNRITTNVDITREDIPFNDTNEGDELAELAIMSMPTWTTKQPPDPCKLETGSDKRPLVRFYVDHSKRTFSTDASCSSHDNHMRPTEDLDHEAAYMEWVGIFTQHPDSYLFMPSARPKEYRCLGRKIAQRVVWDHQDGHFRKIDLVNAFSPMECSVLLQALQKKNMSDKQCQKIIRTVIGRFLEAGQLHRHLIEPTPKSIDQEGDMGRGIDFVTLLALIAWMGPMLGVPSAYFHRLRRMVARADGEASLSDLWRKFIVELLKEWVDLGILLALVLIANIVLLSLPGMSEPFGTESTGTYSTILADVSHGIGIVSTFLTLGGLLTAFCLTWLHQPLQGTGLPDACKYLLGSAHAQTDEGLQSIQKLGQRASFFRLVLVATLLGMPLVLLLWSTIAFVISALTWTFLFSSRATQVAVVTICGLVLTAPFIAIIVFWSPVALKDKSTSRAIRKHPKPTR